MDIDDLRDVDWQILRFVRNSEDPVGTSDIADALDYSDEYSKRRARKLARQEFIEGEKRANVIGLVVDGDIRDVLQGDRDWAINFINNWGNLPQNHDSMATDDLIDYINNNVIDNRQWIQGGWRFDDVSDEVRRELDGN